MDTSRIMKMEDLNLVWSREANESIIKGCVILWMQWEAASCLCNFAWVKMGKRIVRRRDRLFCFRRYYPSIFLSWKSFFFWQINVPSFCSLHFSHHFAQWPSFDSKTCLMLHKKKKILSISDRASANFRSTPYCVYSPETYEGHWKQLTVRTSRKGHIMAIAYFNPQVSQTHSFRTAVIWFYGLGMLKRNRRITWCGLPGFAALILCRLIW